MKHPRTHRTLSGIDIAAPGGLDALFAHHRALFGDATMSADAGDAGAGAGGGTGDAGAGGTGDAGAGDKGGDGGKPPAGTDWDGKVESLPEPVQKLIRELRTENGDRRTKLTAAETKQQEIVRAFAKAAGIDLPGDDAQPDPAKLTEQLTATQAQARRASVELAVYRAAGTHQGDPNALLDSNAFLAKVTDLDPAAADFQSKVDDAIKTAVAANPKLKATQAVGKSGVDHSAGGSGEGRNRTPRPLTDAVAGHYGTA